MWRGKAHGLTEQRTLQGCSMFSNLALARTSLPQPMCWAQAWADCGDVMFNPALGGGRWESRLHKVWKLTENAMKFIWVCGHTGVQYSLTPSDPLSEKRTKKFAPSRGNVNYAVIKKQLKHCSAVQVKHISTYSANGGNIQKTLATDKLGRLQR